MRVVWYSRYSLADQLSFAPELKMMDRFWHDSGNEMLYLSPGGDNSFIGKHLSTGKCFDKGNFKDVKQATLKFYFNIAYVINEARKFKADGIFIPDASPFIALAIQLISGIPCARATGDRFDELLPWPISIILAKLINIEDNLLSGLFTRGKAHANWKLKDGARKVEVVPDCPEDVIRTYDAADIRKQLNIITDKPITAYIGRMLNDRGIDILLEAFKPYGNYGFKLILVGSGPDSPKPPYPEWLTVTGHVVDTLPYLQVADVIVAIRRTTKTMIPGSMLRGMALGKVVIAENSSGPSEWIQDGINGYLYDGGTDVVESLNAKLYDAITNRSKVGKNAKNRVEYLTREYIGKEYANSLKRMFEK